MRVQRRRGRVLRDFMGDYWFLEAGEGTDREALGRALTRFLNQDEWEESVYSFAPWSSGWVLWLSDGWEPPQRSLDALNVFFSEHPEFDAVLKPFAGQNLPWMAATGDRAPWASLIAWSSKHQDLRRAPFVFAIEGLDWAEVVEWIADMGPVLLGIGPMFQAMTPNTKIDKSLFNGGPVGTVSIGHPDPGPEAHVRLVSIDPDGCVRMSVAYASDDPRGVRGCYEEILGAATRLPEHFDRFAVMMNAEKEGGWIRGVTQRYAVNAMDMTEIPAALRRATTPPIRKLAYAAYGVLPGEACPDEDGDWVVRSLSPTRDLWERSEMDLWFRPEGPLGEETPPPPRIEDSWRRRNFTPTQ